MLGPGIDLLAANCLSFCLSENVAFMVVFLPDVNMLEENKCQFRILHPAEISFKNEDDIKTYHSTELLVLPTPKLLFSSNSKNWSGEHKNIEVIRDSSSFFFISYPVLCYIL